MTYAMLNQKVRELSRDVGEGTISRLLGAERRDSTSGADLVQYDYGHVGIEVKCRLHGQPVNILIKQLLELNEDDIYAMVFYKTLSGERPLQVVKGFDRQTPLIMNFEDSIRLTRIFMFPVSHIMEFYEKTHMKEKTISSSGLKHKGLSVASADAIFEKSGEPKAIFKTPVFNPKSPELLTHVVGAKAMMILEERGLKKM